MVAAPVFKRIAEQVLPYSMSSRHSGRAMTQASYQKQAQTHGEKHSKISRPPTCCCCRSNPKSAQLLRKIRRAILSAQATSILRSRDFAGDLGAKTEKFPFPIFQARPCAKLRKCVCGWDSTRSWLAAALLQIRCQRRVARCGAVRASRYSLGRLQKRVGENREGHQKAGQPARRSTDTKEHGEDGVTHLPLRTNLSQMR